jgi:hypothetical protein
VRHVDAKKKIRDTVGATQYNTKKITGIRETPREGECKEDKERNSRGNDTRTRTGDLILRV